MSQRNVIESIRKRLQYAGIDKKTRAMVMHIVKRSFNKKIKVSFMDNKVMDEVLEQIAVASHIPETVLTSPETRRMIVVPRSYAMYLMSIEHGVGVVAIGRKFGRHYTTVIHNIKTIQRLMEVKDPAVVHMIKQYRNLLTAPAGSRK